MSRLVVELAGPAGAGKTTLARALLAAGGPATALGVQVGRMGLARGLASVGPGLVTARMSTAGRGWTRDELRSLAYLSAWRKPVSRKPSADQELLLLDHGPVFRLASLLETGHPQTLTPAFRRLWAGLARDWGRLLDVVVWLDAPDEVLLRRIERRTQAHRIRGSDRAGAEAFLDRYRAAYRTTLEAVTSAGARLVELDTTSSPAERQAAQLRAILLSATTQGPVRG